MIAPSIQVCRGGSETRPMCIKLRHDKGKLFWQDESANLHLGAQEFPMTTVTELAHSLQTVLTGRADALGRESGFVQRQVKLTGGLFTQILTFGCLADPHATLDSLSQTAQALGVCIKI